MKPEYLVNGFRGSGLWPLDISKPGLKVVSLQKERKEEQVGEDHRLLQKAILETIAPPASEATKRLEKSSKARRKRVQAKRGEVLTTPEVLDRMAGEERSRKETRKRKSRKVTCGKRSKQMKTSSTNPLLIDIPRDGNCLFTCISLAVFKTKHITTANIVRKTAVEFIVSNWDMFKDSIVVHNVHTPEEYQTYMSASTIFGDNPEVAALSQVYRICIKVFTGPNFDCHNDSTYGVQYADSRTIRLHYSPEELHYSLIDEEEVLSCYEDNKCFICKLEYSCDEGENDWVGCEKCPRWICGHCLTADFDKTTDYFCIYCK